MSGSLLAGPVILGLQLVAMYVLGSYAMSALGSIGAASGMASSGRLLFYLLVAPGVICHESAHYLACKITGTPVGKFRPFAPSTDPTGRTTLGYVTHASRGPLTAAVIGMAPVLANPLLLVVLTAYITPVEPLAGTALATPAGGQLTDSGVFQAIGDMGSRAARFATGEPLLFLVWAYLALSLSLGAVPSRSDLVAVPAALFVVALGGFIYASVFGTGFLWSVSQAAVYGISLYLLPLVVAAVAALCAAASRS